MNTNEHENLVSTAQIDKGVRDKFEEWKNILIGEDIHSIRKQIYEMIQDSAYFQCLNESRKYSLKDDKGEIKQNKMLHDFINQSFFKTQLLSIRRLVDKDFLRVEKGKPYTVYSLYNLIEDIKKNSNLLTRENILSAYDFPYDYEKELSEYKKTIDCTKPYFVPFKIDSSETLHYRIDSVTGITPDRRSPDDLIPVDILKQFDDKLACIEELCKYVDKYIAHAATPESRIDVQSKIDSALGKVLNAHKIICETAHFIGNKILFCGFGEVLPLPQYGKYGENDLFEYLDEPIASKETMEEIRKVWMKYWKETQDWHKNLYRE